MVSQKGLGHEKDCKQFDKMETSGPVGPNKRHGRFLNFLEAKNTEIPSFNARSTPIGQVYPPIFANITEVIKCGV